MPKPTPGVRFEQHNVQAVFVVVDADGNEYRDALIMPETEFRKLTPSQLDALAMERAQAHQTAVAVSARQAAPPSVEEVALQVAALDQQRAALVQQMLAPESGLPRAERRRLARTISTPQE